MSMIEIRTETSSDYSQVEEVINAAFSGVEFSDQTEAALVSRLRNSKSFLPELSLVALIKNRIVGHILLSIVQLVNDDSTFDLLALAPVSVHPDFQFKGVGAALIKESHSRALQNGYNAIALIGHSGYYPKFGYVQASRFDIHFPFEAPPENCMMVELEEGALYGKSGVIEYPKEFYG